MTAAELVSDGADTNVRRVSSAGRRWLAWGGVAAVVLAGTFWYGFGRGGGVSASAAVADCAKTLPNSGPSGGWTLVPTVIGLGSTASLIAFDTTKGWRWCFDGIGGGGGSISSAEMHSALVAPVAVVDGGLNRDVLLLVDHNPRTVSVVVDTASSKSFVLARGGGFEVLRVPMAQWPRWHAPWSRVPVALGRIIGFDSVGRVTSSQPFTWCPGSIDTFPGQGC